MKAKGYAYKVLLLIIISNKYESQSFYSCLSTLAYLKSLIVRGTDSGMNGGHKYTL